MKDLFKQVIIATCVMLFITSCGDDDDAGSNEINRADLIGVWILESQDGEPVSSTSFTIIVSNNGDWREETREGSFFEAFEGTWSLSGSTVIINYDDGDITVVEVLSVTSNRMSVRVEGVLAEFSKI